MHAIDQRISSEITEKLNQLPVENFKLSDKTIRKVKILNITLTEPYKAVSPVVLPFSAIAKVSYQVVEGELEITCAFTGSASIVDDHVEKLVKFPYILIERGV